MASPESHELEGYYAGLRGNPKCLARSSNQAMPPRPPPADTFGGGTYKHVGAIIRHPIKTVLEGEGGLREKIRAQLATMNLPKWISVDYFRIRYGEKSVENPVVILITTDAGKVEIKEARRVTDLIRGECVLLGLIDVDVEVMEGKRWPDPDDVEER